MMYTEAELRGRIVEVRGRVTRLERMLSEGIPAGPSCEVIGQL